MINDRKMRILRAITEDYISTAEPIGSRTIARKYDLGVSPATIRNEMADLEESGYLKQPHTSAGRVPSDKGYRMYVDCLMDPIRLSLEEQEKVRKEIVSQARIIEELVHQTSRLLSMLTNYTAVVLGPKLSRGTFRHIQLVPMDSRNVLVVLVVDPGFVHNKIVQLAEPTDAVALDRLAMFLNSKLRGLAIEEIGVSLLVEIRDEIGNERLFSEAMEFLRSVLHQDSNEKVYLDGAIQIFNHPEFKDVDRARVLLQILEDNKTLFDVMSKADNGSGSAVTIGEENQLTDLRDCSLITATYSIGGHVVGTVGVIGPTRMEYSKSTAVVECVASLLSELLTGMDRR